MISDTCFHGWREANTLVNPAEIVMHEVKRNRVLEILESSLKRHLSAGSCGAFHAHREVVPFANAGRNVRVFRLPDNLGLTRTHTNGERIANLSVVSARLACPKSSLVARSRSQFQRHDDGH
jgi:hypothetical protein